MDKPIFVSIDPEERYAAVLSEAEAVLKKIKFLHAKSENEASKLLQSMKDSNICIVYLLHDLKKFRVSKKYLNDFPFLKKILLVEEISLNKLPAKIKSSDFIIFPFLKSGNDLGLIINQILIFEKQRLDLENEIERSSVSIDRVTGAANAFMQSHQDLATLVHCGQELQGDLELKNACERIITSLKEIGLDTEIHFAEKGGEQEQYCRLAEDSEKHFEVLDDTAMLFFREGSYSGYIRVKTVNGDAFDIERFGDIIHLFKNQLTVFIERLIGAEEREKLFAGYKAILDKLEDMIMSSDISQKAHNVQKELESDTESVFQLLDKIREKIPEEFFPWLDEIELSLQFGDKVSQQINSLVGIIRELMGVLNPELEDENKSKNAESASNILESSEEAKQDVEDLLASLGM